MFAFAAGDHLLILSRDKNTTGPPVVSSLVQVAEATTQDGDDDLETAAEGSSGNSPTLAVAQERTRMHLRPPKWNGVVESLGSFLERVPTVVVAQKHTAQIGCEITQDLVSLKVSLPLP